MMADTIEKPVAIIIKNIATTSATLSKLGRSDSSTMATAARALLATVAYMPTLLWCFIVICVILKEIGLYHS